MVGNILRFNNIYNRIVIASETQDNKQIYFLGGRLFYYILYFKPIEASSIQGKGMLGSLKLITKFGDLQGRINDGEIPLEDPKKGYRESVEELNQIEKSNRVLKLRQRHLYTPIVA